MNRSAEFQFGANLAPRLPRTEFQFGAPEFMAPMRVRAWTWRLPTNLLRRDAGTGRPARGRILDRFAAPCGQRSTALNPEYRMATKPNTKQTFAIRAPAALSVQLVGDFTHWQKSPIQMHRETGGLWRAGVELAPGTYHYRFLVDGEWRDDPENTLRVPNCFGTQNAVCQIA